MVNQSTFLDRPSIMQGLLQSIENKIRFGGSRDPPPHDAISKRIDDEGHIDKALPRRHIRKIADPEKVRSWCSEHAVHLVTRTGC